MYQNTVYDHMYIDLSQRSFIFNTSFHAFSRYCGKNICYHIKIIAIFMMINI